MPEILPSPNCDTTLVFFVFFVRLFSGEKDVKWSPTGNQELWRADWGIKQWLPFMLGELSAYS